MPSTYKPFDPKEYELSSVTIKTERNLHQVDITQGIVNFNIFEHMDKPYLTGDITTRATGLTGSPFYCYATLADNNLRFYDLYTLIRRPSINGAEPYFYSSYITQNANINVDITRIASEMTTTSNDNTLQLLLDGDLGATYEFVDPTHALEYSFNYDLDTTLQNILGAEAYPVADTKSPFGSKAISKYQTKRFNLLAPSLLYYDQKNPYEEYNTAAHTSKAIQKSLRKLIGQEAIDIMIPGLHTMPQGQNGNKTIGRVISFISLGDTKQVDESTNSYRSFTMGDCITNK